MSQFNAKGEGLLLVGLGQMEIARAAAEALSRGMVRLAKRVSNLAAPHAG